MAPGSIVLFNVNQPGADVLDDTIWQLCDGSEIIHPDSPLRTIGVSHRYTPDIDEKLLRVGDLYDNSQYAGIYSWTFEHNHTGYTGLRDPNMLLVYDGDEYRWAGTQHSHVIDNALSAPVTLDYPAWFRLAAYMKIR